MGHGSLLAGRYRLEERLRTGTDGSLWRGVDETLDRSVSVRIVRPGHRHPADVVDAARRAALVEDARLVRVLDAGEADGGAYIVCEHLVGRTLDELLSDGPVPAETARRLVGEAAQALDRASTRGLHHLQLTPASLVVAPDGTVKVLGTAVDAALAGVDRDEDPVGADRTDAIGLVGVLYAALTGRWPGTLDGTLGAAPRVTGRTVPPGDLVAGVPNDLDTLCTVTLGPHDDGPQSPGELARQLAPWGRAEPLSEPHGLSLDCSPRPARGPAEEALVTQGASAARTSRPVAPSGRTAAPGDGAMPTLLPVEAETDSAVDPFDRPAVPLAAGAAPAGLAAAHEADADERGEPDADEPDRGDDDARRSEASGDHALGRAVGTRMHDDPDPVPVTPPPRRSPAPPAGGPGDFPVGGLDAGPGDERPKPGDDEWSLLSPPLRDRHVSAEEEPLGPFMPPAPLSRPPQDQARLVLAVVAGLVVLGLVLAIFSLRGLRAATPLVSPGPLIPTATPNGTVNRASDAAAPPPGTAPSSTGSTGLSSSATGEPPEITGIQAIDPEGDGDENGSTADRAVDGDESTTWRSNRYQSADFGGLKKGLGLYLAGSGTVTKVTVEMSGTGGVVELRTASGPGLDSSTVVATAEVQDGKAVLTPKQPVPGSSLLLWFTSLPQQSNGEYRLVISEISVA